MSSPQEYRQRIDKLLGGGQLGINVSDVPRAKQTLREIIQLQKQLRQIKREIDFDMKQIRALYQDKASSAGSGSASMFTLFGKRKLAGQVRAGAKRNLAKERDSQLTPYSNLKLTIDDLILQIDDAKLRLQNFIQNPENDA